MTEPAHSSLSDLTTALARETGDPLTRLLLEAPVSTLEAALANPGLREDQLLLALRRSDLTSDFLVRVADDPEWVGSYLVKAALVAHRHTPKITALALVKYLYWRDLAKLVANFHILPAVRRMAEVVLKDRLGQITLGERIALARMAPREVIRALRSETDERVVATLLANPRLTEEDVVLMASGRNTPAKVLTLLARSERWSARYPLRLTLLRNPHTPLHDALALLAGLRERDLKMLSETPDTPRAIRTAAARRVAG